MRTLLRTSLIAFVAVPGLSLAGAPAPAPAPRAPAGPTIQQRIDALLKRRLRPEPLPVNLPNPFQMSGGIVREATPEEIAARAAEPDGAALANAINSGKINANPVEVLATVSSRFKIGGVIALKDQLQLVINGVPRKEGDSVAADWNGALVFVKIVRLSAGQIVLRYGEAEITMKF